LGYTNTSDPRLLVTAGLVARNNSDDFHEWSPYADKSKLAAAVSLFLWIGVMYFGRMLPYLGNAF